MNIRNFQIEQDPFSKNAESNNKIDNEVLLLMIFAQTKPQNENMNITYHDLYYTVIKNRDEKEIVVNEKESSENDFINYEEFIAPIHFNGQKNNEMLI